MPQLEQETPIEVTERAPQWSLPALVAVRFGFCYLILFLYPSFLGGRPANAHPQTNLAHRIWEAVVPWVGERILHLQGSLTPIYNGSGDQLYDYVQWFCIVVIAVLAAAIWSFLDRNRKEYEALHEWLRIIVRLTVAVCMIIYGMAKLFRFQFPELPLAKLVDTYGQSSPQGLLWAFMEYSHGYSLAGGLGELAGGILLLVPRFTALGALISLGMTANVLMLNVFYDVPRKILCINLILMCLFLLWQDMRRLADFFLLNRTVQLTPPRPLFRDKGMNTVALLCQFALGIAALAYYANHYNASAGDQAARVEAPLRGIWNVAEFDFDGVPRLPLLTDKERWQRVIFDRPKLFIVQLMDGTQQSFYVQSDPESRTFSLWGGDNFQSKGKLTAEEVQPNQMVLEGQMNGHSLTLHLQRADLSDQSKFWLINHDFRFVSPSPLLR